MKQKITGFTLAEILITLSIIGVVAALTIPQLMKNLNDYALSKAQTITLAKITEATNQMKSNDVLDGYATTEAFADEFQKYLKVSKRCTSANLTDCFAPNFTSAGGKQITTTSLITGNKLGQPTYTSPTVAFGLANGTTILFAFNPTCVRIDPTDNQTNTTSCLSLVYDVNGNSKPNIIGKDISTVNAEFDYLDIGGLLIAVSDSTYTSINTCDGSPDISYDPRGSTNVNCATNNWAGAKKACSVQNMKIPSKDELDIIYQNRASISGLNLGSTYWSSTMFSASNIWNQYFADGSQNNNAANANGGKARCIK